MFAATSNSPSATGTAITEHSKHTAETCNGTIHAYQLEVRLSLLLVEARQSTLGGFKSPGWHPSETILFGPYYLYELLTVDHMLGENFKRVQKFMYGILICFRNKKHSKIHLKYRKSKDKHTLEIRIKIFFFSYLVHFSFLYHILCYILDYLWAQDQKYDLQWPNCCFTFCAFCKAIH